MTDAIVKLSKFDAPDSVSMRKAVASAMPDGDVWKAKNIPESVLGRLISASSESLRYTQGNISLLVKELNVNTTELLISEWEKSVGLPSPCRVLLNESIENRRGTVRAKLRKTPVVTLEQMQEIVDQNFPDLKLKLRREAESGVEFPYVFPISFTASGRVSRFVIIVDVYIKPVKKFPLEFPIEFEGVGVDVSAIKCLLRGIIRGDDAIVFNYIEDESIT